MYTNPEAEAKQKYFMKLLRNSVTVESFNLDDIMDGLSNITDECENYRETYGDEEEWELLIEIAGDDMASEFKFLYSDLACECDRLYDALRDSYITDCFDDFFIKAAQGHADMSIYDEGINDIGYYKLTEWDEKFAAECAEKRISKLTKAEILNAANQCFGIAIAWIDIKKKYEQLSTVFEVIQAKGVKIIELIRMIDAAYEKGNAENWLCWSKATENYDRLLAMLPAQMWVE